MIYDIEYRYWICLLVLLFIIRMVLILFHFIRVSCRGGAYSICYVFSVLSYLQHMKQLQNIMDETTYNKYTTYGYWALRRSHRFWSGIFTDQTIKQMLIKMLKAQGLAHDITSSTQPRMANV